MSRSNKHRTTTPSIRRRLEMLLFTIFTAVLALGVFNPFAISKTYVANDASERSILTLTVEVVFIGYLLLFQRGIGMRGNWKNPLCLFSAVFALTTFVNSFDSSVGIDKVLQDIIKFLLCAALCIKLPAFLGQRPRLNHIGLATYATVMGVIATAYILGFLGSAADFHNGRLWLFGENPNATSLRFVLAVIIMFHLAIANPLGWRGWRWLLILLNVPMITAIMASGSRGSFIIVMVCMAVYALWYPTRRKIAKYIGTALVTLAMGGVIVNLVEENTDWALFNRLEKTAESGDDAGRAKINKMTMDIFSDYPVFGTGQQLFREEMMSRFAEKRPSHNLYVYLFAATGIVGAGVFYLFLARIACIVWSSRHYSSFPMTIFLFVLLLASKMGGILSYIVMWYAIASTIALVNETRNCHKNRFHTISDHHLFHHQTSTLNDRVIK